MTMFERSHALITGGTKGIGFAIAMELGARGIVPLLNYREDEATAIQACQKLSEIGIETWAIQADVTSEEGVRQLFENAASHGPIDVLINNVGEFIFKPFLETSRSDWYRILDSNLISTALCCQHALPLMRERQRGHIINIASMHASEIRARPNTLPYAIAKSGIIHLTHTLAKTEGAYGIRVNAICPGFVEGGDHTHAGQISKVPLGRLGQPADVARAVRFLISPEAEYITGAVLNIHGGALL